jgi:hypothetical protein
MTTKNLTQDMLIALRDMYYEGMAAGIPLAMISRSFSKSFNLDYVLQNTEINWLKSKDWHNPNKILSTLRDAYKNNDHIKLQSKELLDNHNQAHKDSNISIIPTRYISKDVKIEETDYDICMNEAIRQVISGIFQAGGIQGGATEQMQHAAILSTWVEVFRKINLIQKINLENTLLNKKIQEYGSSASINEQLTPEITVIKSRDEITEDKNNKQ